MTRRRAPWPDFAGNPIHEGDRIEHPEGEAATVVYDEARADTVGRWRAVYNDGISLWLGNQIGPKGQAVVKASLPPDFQRILAQQNEALALIRERYERAMRGETPC